MKLSARNTVPGTIQKIDIGAVNAQVTIEVVPGIALVSIITVEAVKNLGLAEGKRAYAVIKGFERHAGRRLNCDHTDFRPRTAARHMLFTAGKRSIMNGIPQVARLSAPPRKTSASQSRASDAGAGSRLSPPRKTIRR
jgi:molybdopterin-binding protein